MKKQKILYYYQNIQESILTINKSFIELKDYSASTITLSIFTIGLNGFLDKLLDALEEKTICYKCLHEIVENILIAIRYYKSKNEIKPDMLLNELEDCLQEFLDDLKKQKIDKCNYAENKGYREMIDEIEVDFDTLMGDELLGSFSLN